MDPIRFEWSAAKAATNRRKHGVSFEEASTAFADEQAIVIDDPEHVGEDASSSSGSARPHGSWS